jgi:hypothetical protein
MLKSNKNLLNVIYFWGGDTMLTCARQNGHDPRAVGKEAKRPADWVVTQEAKEFMGHLSNAGQNGIWKSRRGNNGGTYAVL